MFNRDDYYKEKGEDTRLRATAALKDKKGKPTKAAIAAAGTLEERKRAKAGIVKATLPHEYTHEGRLNKGGRKNRRDEQFKRGNFKPIKEA